MTSARIDFPHISDTGRPRGRYSHVAVVQSGPLAFVSGQLAINAEGDVIGEGDFESQVRQVFDNLDVALRGLGGTFADVARFTTFLVNAEHIAEFMRVRTELFEAIYPDGVYPGNTLLVVDRLVEEPFLIEIEAIAALAGGSDE